MWHVIYGTRFIASRNCKMYLLIVTVSYTANIEFVRGGWWLIMIGILPINKFIFHYENLLRNIKWMKIILENHWLGCWFLGKLILYSCTLHYSTRGTQKYNICNLHMRRLQINLYHVGYKMSCNRRARRASLLHDILYPTWYKFVCKRRMCRLQMLLSLIQK